jgi:hypothetical protein
MLPTVEYNVFNGLQVFINATILPMGEYARPAANVGYLGDILFWQSHR